MPVTATHQTARTGLRERRWDTADPVPWRPPPVSGRERHFPVMSRVHVGMMMASGLPPVPVHSGTQGMT